jgi:transposase
MPRYKEIVRGMKLLPIDLSVQLLPGTFVHAVSHLIDHELDLRVFDARFHNDDGGAPAYPPSVMLKVILYAYSRGIIRSRDMARACQQNIVFMTLSGDNIPHFTTLASFVRELKNEIADLFTQVLFLCDAQGLIGREMFAIDGVKLPSNASKARSGTRAEFKRQADKLALDLIGGSKSRSRRCSIATVQAMRRPPSLPWSRRKLNASSGCKRMPPSFVSG